MRRIFPLFLAVAAVLVFGAIGVLAASSPEGWLLTLPDGLEWLLDDGDTAVVGVSDAYPPPGSTSTATPGAYPPPAASSTPRASAT